MRRLAWLPLLACLACAQSSSASDSGDAAIHPPASPAHAGDTDAARVDAPRDAPPPRPPNWQALHLCQEGDPMDPLSVSEAHVEGHTLQLTVTHAGGCEPHAYGLCSTPAFALSDPAMNHFHVLHDAMGDPCTDIETMQLSFDLVPFQRIYARAFPGEEPQNTAVIHVADCEDDQQLFGACSVYYAWPKAPPTGHIVDAATGEVSISGDGLYYKDCRVGLWTLTGDGPDRWRPSEDDRPWPTRGPYYLGDTFVPNTHQECEVAECQPLTDTRIWMLEYQQVDTRPPPDEAEGDVPDAIPVVESRVAPRPWAVNIRYYVEPTCSDRPNAMLVELDDP